MDFILNFGQKFLLQFQSPTLGFLIGGMLIAATKSKLKIPDAIYQFIVFMLLMKIGIKGGLEIKNANISDIIIPAAFSIMVGISSVILGNIFFSLIPKVRRLDGIATSGLFGAVSASTLAAGMVVLEQESVAYEAWVPALYPFMDIPALILAIVISNIYLNKTDQAKKHETNVLRVIKDSMRGSALSALILGLLLGLLTKTDVIYQQFYEPMFKGFLSVLMLVMGMEAYSRIHELKKVAHWFALYALVAPIINGLIAFGLGYIAHHTVNFSPGGVILFSIIAASNSDISGPPTLRAAIPSANPSTYLGASTSIGTPVAIVICIPLFLELGRIVFNL